MIAVAAVIAICGLVGCAQQTPAPAYIKADRVTLEKFRPIADIAKDAEPFLAPDIDNTMKSWETRVSDAEQGIFPKE